jgi:hypothetical protein
LVYGLGTSGVCVRGAYYRASNASGRHSAALSENLFGDPFFELSERPNLVSAHSAVNMSVVGVIFAKVELVITTDGTI